MAKAKTAKPEQTQTCVSNCAFVGWALTAIGVIWLLMETGVIANNLPLIPVATVIVGVLILRNSLTGDSCCKI